LGQLEAIVQEEILNLAITNRERRIDPILFSCIMMAYCRHQMVKSRSVRRKVGRQVTTRPPQGRYIFYPRLKIWFNNLTNIYQVCTPFFLFFTPFFVNFGQNFGVKKQKFWCKKCKNFGVKNQKF